MSENHDVLSGIDIPTHLEETHTSSRYETTELNALKKEKAPRSKIISGVIFGIKYCFTAVAIFTILILASNYSAYSGLVYSFFFAEEMQQTQNNLIQSVLAADLSKDGTENIEANQGLSSTEDAKNYNIHSLSNLIAKANADDTGLNIEITPYENRIVIPKIGKNIPLIDIKQKSVSGTDELNDIFMDELENGVIRYPGSAKPGEEGNSFIFGHSSNFPWMDGEYNDVFALLDKVIYDDEVIVYYGQEKYTYKIERKEVIRPGDVSVLKNNDGDRSELTLMTCWPIGTTLNRLILVGRLVDIE